MPYATLTSKGQITIPKEIRDRVGLEAGDRVLFTALAGSRIVLMPRNGDIRALSGMLYDPDRKPMTIEEMNDAIADAAAESGMAGLE